jgi:hypothetical protein
MKRAVALALIELGLPRRAVVLMERILYWWPKASGKERGGIKYLYNPREEWAAQCGHTLATYKRAISDLRALDLVRTKRFLHSDKQGIRPITHITLGEAGLALYVRLSCANPSAHTCAIPMAHTCAIGMEHVCAEQITPYLLSTSKDLQAAPSATAKFSPKSKKGFEEEEIEKKEKQNSEGDSKMKMNELKNAYSNLPALPVKTDKANTSSGLSKLYRRILAEKYGIPIHALSDKDKGQLGTLLKACPDGTAADHLAFVLENWTAFVQRMEDKFKAFPLSPSPTPGFIAKWASYIPSFKQGYSAVSTSSATSPAGPSQSCVMLLPNGEIYGLDPVQAPALAHNATTQEG